MKGLGFDVDDNNEPAVEKEQASKWEWDGACRQKAKDYHNNNPSLRGVIEFNISSMSYAGMFIVLFPMRFVQEAMLVQMNSKEEGLDITYGEFLCFIGIWFFMATGSGFSRANFFLQLTSTVVLEHRTD